MPFIGFSPIWVIFGYLMGAIFSAHIFMDVSQTHWNNIWTYIWLFMWPVCLVWFFLYYLLIGFTILVLVVFAVGMIFDAGPMARSR